MKYLITHYTPEEPDRDNWIVVRFFARRINERLGPVFVGFQEHFVVPPEELGRLEAEGAVIPIQPPRAIDSNQRLWMSPEQELYIADANEPESDELRQYIPTSCGPDVGVETASGTPPSLLQQSSVAQHACKSFDVAPGDYLNSRVRPHQIYKPLWNIELIKEMVSELARIAAKDIKVHEQEWQEHKYYFLADQIDYERLPLSLELVLLTKRRRARIDILHLANVRTLCLAFQSDSAAPQMLGLVNRLDSARAPQYSKWISSLGNSGLRVCAHSDTSADELVMNAISERKIKSANKTQYSNITDLLAWLKKEPSGVIVCDTGIAHQLHAAALDRGEPDVSFVEVCYPEPLRAGLAFPADDPHWGRFLARCFETVWKNPRARESFVATMQLCRDVGAVWIYGETSIDRVVPHHAGNAREN